jgi:plastocyanin
LEVEIMRRIAVLLSAMLAGAATAGVATAGVVAEASPSPGNAVVTIHHQVQHCHAWSVNGGPFAASQKLSLHRGGTITFANNDVMPHRLIELAGPRVTMPGAMNHTGATTKLTFARLGVYRFKTLAGEDYMSGIKTTGEDNVLMLTVTVR